MPRSKPTTPAQNALGAYIAAQPLLRMTTQGTSFHVDGSVELLNQPSIVNTEGVIQRAWRSPRTGRWVLARTLPNTINTTLITANLPDSWTGAPLRLYSSRYPIGDWVGITGPDPNHVLLLPAEPPCPDDLPLPGSEDIGLLMVGNRLLHVMRRDQDLLCEPLATIASPPGAPPRLLSRTATTILADLLIKLRRELADLAHQAEHGDRRIYTYPTDRWVIWVGPEKTSWDGSATLYMVQNRAARAIEFHDLPSTLPSGRFYCTTPSSEDLSLLEVYFAATNSAPRLHGTILPDEHQFPELPAFLASGSPQVKDCLTLEESDRYQGAFANRKGCFAAWQRQDGHFVLEPLTSMDDPYREGFHRVGRLLPVEDSSTVISEYLESAYREHFAAAIELT